MSLKGEKLCDKNNDKKGMLWWFRHLKRMNRNKKLLMKKNYKV